MSLLHAFISHVLGAKEPRPWMMVSLASCPNVLSCVVLESDHTYTSGQCSQGEAKCGSARAAHRPPEAPAVLLRRPMGPASRNLVDRTHRTVWGTSGLCPTPHTEVICSPQLGQLSSPRGKWGAAGKTGTFIPELKEPSPFLQQSLPLAHSLVSLWLPLPDLSLGYTVLARSS